MTNVPNGIKSAFIYQSPMESAIVKVNLLNLDQMLVQKLIKIKASEPSKFLPIQTYQPQK